MIELESYSRPTCIKLVHSATTRSTVVGVINKLTVVVNEFVDHTNTPTTYCGEIFKSRVLDNVPEGCGLIFVDTRISL